VISRRLASLAVFASLVLLVGLYVRARLERANQAAPDAPPSEASPLQQLSHEGLLRRASSFVQKRASESARFVVYVPRTGASGIRWRADTVLSAGRHRPLDVSADAAADSGAPTIRQLSDSTRGEWVLVVGRARSGTVLSLAGSVGGRVRARCDVRDVDELLLNVPLTEALAGAAVFDIEGALVGIVIRCGERLAAVPVRQIAALLAEDDSAKTDVVVLGASLAPLDTTARAYFGVDTGALVSAVRWGTLADSLGLRAGDVLLSIDGAPIATPLDAARALTSRGDTTHQIVRLRGRTRSVISLLGADTVRGTSADPITLALGIGLPSAPRPDGVAVVGIAPGSAAYAAGLRTGDKLTRIGTADVTSRSDVDRLFRAAPAGPIFITFDRDSVEYGALLRR
jgi:S1-C subfamily serine protease